MNNTQLFMDIVGWVGAGSLLCAYLLISNDRIAGKSYLYQGLNTVGSFGLVLNSFYYGAMPSVILNVIWVMIGIYTFNTMIRKPKEQSNE